MLKETYKNIGIFFLTVLLTGLLIFFEKRISLVQSQLISEQKVLKSFQSRLDLSENQIGQFSFLEKKFDSINEKINQIEKKDSMKNIVQDKSRENFSIRDDFFLFTKNYLGELIKTSRKDQALNLVKSLASLEPERKKLWLEKINKAPTWELIVERLTLDKAKSEELKENKTRWNWAEKFGITIARTERREQFIDSLEGFLLHGRYQKACQFLESHKLSEQNQFLIEEICHFDARLD
jgi:hypothetical protein